jgi:hypothetical protein
MEGMCAKRPIDVRGDAVGGVGRITALGAAAEQQEAAATACEADAETECAAAAQVLQDAEAEKGDPETYKGCSGWC